jgi:hypothetical protein
MLKVKRVFNKKACIIKGMEHQILLDAIKNAYANRPKDRAIAAAYAKIKDIKL